MTAGMKPQWTAGSTYCLVLVLDGDCGCVCGCVFCCVCCVFRWWCWPCCCQHKIWPVFGAPDARPAQRRQAAAAAARVQRKATRFTHAAAAAVTIKVHDHGGRKPSSPVWGQTPRPRGERSNGSGGSRAHHRASTRTSRRCSAEQTPSAALTLAYGCSAFWTVLTTSLTFSGMAASAEADDMIDDGCVRTLLLLQKADLLLCSMPCYQSAVTSEILIFWM